jgi:hypothetical protein
MSDDLVKMCKRLSKHAHAQLSSADLERIADRIEELETALATARRDALEEAADVAIRMEREMGIQDECGYEPFYTPEDVAHRIRALAEAET